MVDKDEIVCQSFWDRFFKVIRNPWGFLMNYRKTCTWEFTDLMMGYQYYEITSVKQNGSKGIGCVNVFGAVSFVITKYLSEPRGQMDMFLR